MGKPNQTPRRRRAPPSGVELSETLPGGAAQQSAETCHRVKHLRGATLSATSCCDPPAHLGSVKDTLRNVEKRPSADTAVEILLGHYGDGLRLHQLRHSAATHLGEAGIDATVIMAPCGWSSSPAVIVDVSTCLRVDVSTCGQICRPTAVNGLVSCAALSTLEWPRRRSAARSWRARRRGA